MAPASLQDYIRAQPFRPFRFVLDSGNTYEIRHPEMIRVGRDFFNYYFATAPDQFPESWDTVSLLLVESVQHLDAAAPNKATGNVAAQV
jgi:hypothetical protein